MSLRKIGTNVLGKVVVITTAPEQLRVMNAQLEDLGLSCGVKVTDNLVGALTEISEKDPLVTIMYDYARFRSNYSQWANQVPDRVKETNLVVHGCVCESSLPIDNARSSKLKLNMDLHKPIDIPAFSVSGSNAVKLSNSPGSSIVEKIKELHFSCMMYSVQAVSSNIHMDRNLLTKSKIKLGFYPYNKPIIQSELIQTTKPDPMCHRDICAIVYCPVAQIDKIPEIVSQLKDSSVGLKSIIIVIDGPTDRAVTGNDSVVVIVSNEISQGKNYAKYVMAKHFDPSDLVFFTDVDSIVARDKLEKLSKARIEKCADIIRDNSGNSLIPAVVLQTVDPGLLMNSESWLDIVPSQIEHSTAQALNFASCTI